LAKAGSSDSVKAALATAAGDADPERRLVLAYAPAPARAGLAVLLALDDRLAQVAAGGRESALAAIRLAWWRDALARLATASPPAEPLLRQVAAVLLPVLPAERLAALAEAAGEDGPGARGATLFSLAARLLGGPADPRLADAGAAWATAGLDGADHGRRVEAAALLDELFATPWPRPLRPLAMLAALARADLRQVPRGAPRRLLTLLRIRLLGR
jgi:15-cis-phytoene synthase